MNLIEQVKHADSRLERMKDLTEGARCRLHELVYPVLKVYSKDPMVSVVSVDFRGDMVDISYSRYCGRGEYETRSAQIPKRVFMADDPVLAAQTQVSAQEAARTKAEAARLFMSAQYMLDSLGNMK